MTSLRQRTAIRRHRQALAQFDRLPIGRERGAESPRVVAEKFRLSERLRWLSARAHP